MGLLSRFKRTAPAAQSARQEPTIQAPDVSNEDGSRELNSIEELTDILGIMPSIAGPVVNSRTAMRVAIVYACTRLIAGAMAGMPIHIFRDAPQGRERDTGHPLAAMLNLQPTPLMSAAMFWEYITSAVLLEGDGFAVIMRDQYGDPVEFLPVSPLAVTVRRRGNRLLYAVQLDDGFRGFDQDDVLHFAGFGFNGERSLSVIKYAAVNSIGLNMAMEQFSGDFFQNGAHQDIAVTKEGRWSAEDQEAFRDAWVRTYGGLGNRRKPLTISKGLSLHQLNINAKDSQLIESRQFENLNIATAFGIPGFMVNQGDKVTAWGSGMAELGLAFIRYTMSPHIVRFEQELNRKLFLRRPEFAEFVTAGLMRGTLKERNEAYKSALGGSNVPGYMAINEVRRIENLPPLDNPVYDQPYDPRLAAPKEPGNAQ
ncbi:MAG: phage portal protein [Porticoccaceae bacterium]|nr:phage portal protein [Porticoccaceae bacterium]